MVFGEWSVCWWVLHLLLVILRGVGWKVVFWWMEGGGFLTLLLFFFAVAPGCGANLARRNLAAGVAPRVVAPGLAPVVGDLLCYLVGEINTATVITIDVAIMVALH